MINITKSKMNYFHYHNWINYFKHNNRQRLKTDFSQETRLSENELALILPSIQAFQRGEGSDGRYLQKAAAKWAKKSGRPEYEEAMAWFIREENQHSSYLKEFMNYYHIDEAKSSFLDWVFRRLRQLAGLRCEVTVLVTAEMIALTYYDALSRSTDSPALKSICRQMLRDELPHIMFQSYTLGQFKDGPFSRLLRILLTEITSLFVWGAFHQVYQAGGYSFSRFFKENLGYLRQSIFLVSSNQPISFK